MFFSAIQFLKHLISGHEASGIKYRRRMSLALVFSVLAIEIAVYSIFWDSFPDLVDFDYDFDGKPNDSIEKNWIWYNVLFQIGVFVFSFLIKYLLCKTRFIHRLLYDRENSYIEIIDRRITLFTWETVMLFVTTEESYIFGLLKFVPPISDNLVTAVYFFWLILLILELPYDIKILKKEYFKNLIEQDQSLSSENKASL